MRCRRLLGGIVARRARRRLQCGGAAAVGALLGSAALPQLASADTITPEYLLQQSTLVINQQSNVYAFTAPGPGTLTVQLQDVVWPTSLQSLTASIDSPSSVLGSLSAAGDLTLNLTSAGTYYADVMGHAGTLLNIGVYSLQVDFIPQGAPVPLPAGLGLLLSGLVMLGGVRLVCKRMRNESFTYAA